MSTQISDPECSGLTSNTHSDKSTENSMHNISHVSLDQVPKTTEKKYPNTGRTCVFWRDKTGRPRIVFGPHWPLTIVVVFLKL